MFPAENIEYRPAENFEKRPLGPSTQLCFLGAGPTTISMALELVSQMGANAPQITFIEQKSYHLDSGADKWENCKGCAARVPLQTLQTLQEKYDPQKEVIKIEGNTVRVNDHGENKFLARNILNEIEFHLPSSFGDRLSSVGRLAVGEQMAMTYRHMGPRVVYGSIEENGIKREEIGLQRALLLLLESQMGKYGKKPQIIQGKVREVDLTAVKPVVLVEQKSGTQTVEADLVVSGLGTASMVKIKNKEGKDQHQKTKRLGTVVREIGINTKEAGKIYGQEFNRAHLFVFPPHGVDFGTNIEYAMLLPQWIKDGNSEQNVVITVAMVERRDDRIKPGPAVKKEADDIITHLSPYLPGGNTIKASFCQCMPSIPVEQLPVADMWDENYLVVGDQAGALRYMKNGIGTGNQAGIRGAQLLIHWGYSPSALQTVATKLDGMFGMDNTYGKELLDWLDEFVSHDRKMSTLASLLLFMEQYFPSDYQVTLDVLKGIGTGISSYEEIIARLFETEGRGTIYRRGMGKMIEIIAQVAGHPVPVEFRHAHGVEGGRGDFQGILA